MGIKKYFKDPIVVQRKSMIDVGGVEKETLTEVWSGKVAVDKSRTSKTLNSNKDGFDFSVALYAPIESGIIENDLVTWDSMVYDVASSADPMERGHHLEVALTRSK